MDNQGELKEWSVKMSKDIKLGQKRVLLEFDLNISKKVSLLDLLFFLINLNFCFKVYQIDPGQDHSNELVVTDGKVKKMFKRIGKETKSVLNFVVFALD